MLKKKYIINKKNDFKKVLEQKKGFKTKYFLIKKKENNLEYSRLGVIVSKKVSKKAVVRNKIKRKIKKTFKESLIKNNKNNFDLIFVVFPGFSEKDLIELEEKDKNIFNFK
ncbi:ribonuclease P protein component [bacterium]|nr:ribonuclease P protein component [bacterium]